MEAVLGRLTAMVSDIGGCKDTIYIYIYSHWRNQKVKGQSNQSNMILNVHTRPLNRSTGSTYPYLFPDRVG